MTLAAVLSALALAAGQPAPAAVPDAAPAPDAEVSTEVAEVVVTARRIGVPVWRVGDGRSAVVFVGAIGAVPESVRWNTAELERAVAGSRRVLYGADVDFTLGDLFRIVFRNGRWIELPEGRSLDTVVGPDLARRLDAQAAADRIPRDWRRQRAWWIAARLQLSITRRREIERGVTAREAADRAAGRAGVRHAPVLQARFNDVIENAAQDRPTDSACLLAWTEVAEAGDAIFAERAQAWTRSRIAETVASPVSRAEATCWPDSDPTLAPRLRQAWRDAVRRELAQPGAVVAVVPLPYLVEQGGLLDDLQGQGLSIDGPAWR